MNVRRLWNPWFCRNHPFLMEEEVAFMKELKTRVVKKEPFIVEREDYTLMLDSLRGGTNIDDLTKCLPGLELERLLAAYKAIERKRTASVKALNVILTNPSLETFELNHKKAAVLNPLITSRLNKALHNPAENCIETVVELINKNISKVKEETLILENTLKLMPVASEEAVILGSKLYNPYQPGLWSSPYYVPERVGVLSPVRVRSLLVESII